MAPPCPVCHIVVDEQDAYDSHLHSVYCAKVGHLLKSTTADAPLHTSSSPTATFSLDDGKDHDDDDDDDDEEEEDQKDHTTSLAAPHGKRQQLTHESDLDSYSPLASTPFIQWLVLAQLDTTMLALLSRQAVRKDWHDALRSRAFWIEHFEDRKRRLRADRFRYWKLARHLILANAAPWLYAPAFLAMPKKAHRFLSIPVAHDSEYLGVQQEDRWFTKEQLSDPSIGTETRPPLLFAILNVRHAAAVGLMRVPNRRGATTSKIVDAMHGLNNAFSLTLEQLDASPLNARLRVILGEIVRLTAQPESAFHLGVIATLPEACSTLMQLHPTFGLTGHTAADCTTAVCNAPIQLLRAARQRLDTRQLSQYVHDTLGSHLRTLWRIVQRVHYRVHLQNLVMRTAFSLFVSDSDNGIELLVGDLNVFDVYTHLFLPLTRIIVEGGRAFLVTPDERLYLAVFDMPTASGNALARASLKLAIALANGQVDQPPLDGSEL